MLLEPIYAARSAAWFWSANKCSSFADVGDIEGLTKRINGGLIGIDDRKKRYASVVRSFSGFA
jgi:putative chitinase